MAFQHIHEAFDHFSSSYVNTATSKQIIFNRFDYYLILPIKIFRLILCNLIIRIERDAAANN